MILPHPMMRLIDELSKLPSIGRKSAQRLTYALLLGPDSNAQALADAIIDAKLKIKSCRKCFSFTSEELCGICRNPKRDQQIICVVEDPRNIVTIENSGIFNGLFHVLQGAISPVNGISPEKLRIQELEQRVKEAPVNELILATNPTMEGEATAHYLTDLFQDEIAVISRIARGIPVGSDMEFADTTTLTRAFEGRTLFTNN